MDSGLQVYMYIYICVRIFRNQCLYVNISKDTFIDVTVSEILRKRLYISKQLNYRFRKQNNKNQFNNCNIATVYLSKNLKYALNKLYGNQSR